MTGPPLRLATAAMGTRFELVLQAGRGDLRAAGEGALEEIEGWHRRLSRFAADSLLSHVNRTAAHAPVRLDRDTFELFADALGVWQASAGAFDITIAQALAGHGHPPSAVPGSAARTGADAIVLDWRHWTIRFAGGPLSLDLGAIAKGHALDCAGRLLRDAGVTSALLHGGTSSVLAIGRPPGQDGWRVAVNVRSAPEIVRLADNALSVSDASGRRSETGAAHILDPRTHAPAADTRAVAVVGPSARLADAWSTALVVLGALPDYFPSGYRCLGLALPAGRQVVA